MPGVSVYRIEIAGESTPIFAALVQSGVTSYTAPSWIRKHAGQPLRWRVVAFGASEAPELRSEWARFELDD